MNFIHGSMNEHAVVMHQLMRMVRLIPLSM